MENLKNLFKESGFWYLSPSGILDVEITPIEKKVLYAFVAGGEFKYIGSTIQFIAARMQNYKNAHKSQETNIRVRKDILNALVVLKTQVKIVSFYPLNLLKTTGATIREIEAYFIRELNPPWNINSWKK